LLYAEFAIHPFKLIVTHGRESTPRFDFRLEGKNYELLSKYYSILNGISVLFIVDQFIIFKF